MDVLGALESMIASGRLVDVALCFIVLEYLFLLWRAPKLHRRTAALNLLFALGPGACLILALRCALTQTDVLWVIFWLALSLPLHIADIQRRKF